MQTVSINPKIIRWGIDRAGLTDQVLEDKFPKLEYWLSGERFPTFKQLQDLAKKIKLPMGYFFLTEPPVEKLPIPYYRTERSTSPAKPSPELMDTLFAMQRRMHWLREYLLENEQAKLDFVGIAKLTDSSQSIAESIRSHLGVTEDWAQMHPTWESALRTMFKLTDDIGINIVTNGIVGNNTRRKLNPCEFRGFVLIDDYAPLVFVNNADCKAAQMFTLAHELAHIWFGASAIFDLAQLQPADDDIEIACNKVAAEFLVPANRLRETWETLSDRNDAYQQLARRFKVSDIVITRRLLDLNLISKAMFFEFYQAYKEKLDERTHAASGGDFYTNQAMRVGHTFMKAVIQAVGEGNLQHIDAFRLTNLYGKAFDGYANRVMGID